MINASLGENKHKLYGINNKFFNLDDSSQEIK